MRATCVVVQTTFGRRDGRKSVWSHWEGAFFKKISQDGTNTAPKFNIALKKLPSQKERSLPSIIFSGAMSNVGSVWKATINNKTKSMIVDDCHILLHFPGSKFSGFLDG